MKTKFNAIKMAFLTLTCLAPAISMADYSKANEKALVKELAQLINMSANSDQISYVVSGTEVNDACTVFMDEDMDLGQLGQFISDEVMAHPNQYSFLLKSGAMKAACPNYLNLENPEDKALVITMLLTAMAQFESSCKNSAHAVGPNGTAQGLYQLHKGKEAHYDGSENVCVKNASLSPQSSSRCTLGMLDHQLQEKGSLFSNKSYWDVLRPNGAARRADDIQRAVSRLSICRVAAK